MDFSCNLRSKILQKTSELPQNDPTQLGMNIDQMNSISKM